MRGLINFDEPILFRRHHLEEQSRPTKQELESARLHWICFNHIAGKRTFKDEYNLILEKKSTLPAACRKFIVEQAKEWQPEQKS